VALHAQSYEGSNKRVAEIAAGLFISSDITSTARVAD